MPTRRSGRTTLRPSCRRSNLCDSRNMARDHNPIAFPKLDEDQIAACTHPDQVRNVTWSAQGCEGCLKTDARPWQLLWLEEQACNQTLRHSSALDHPIIRAG